MLFANHKVLSAIKICRVINPAYFPGGAALTGATKSQTYGRDSSASGSVTFSSRIESKYVQIDPEMVTVQLEQKDGDISILELNVTLPEAEESRP